MNPGGRKNKSTIFKTSLQINGAGSSWLYDGHLNTGERAMKTALTGRSVTLAMFTGVIAATPLVVVGNAAAEELEEVIVTSTRFEETADRVPMSVSAVSQDQLALRGITDVRDLTRTIPGLVATNTANAVAAAGMSNIAIRGVRGTSGAATTGVYLNDTPLQRRFTTSAFQFNGTPTPTLFDLQRVEVLRGPQGTLYGGSSLGGTLRFITPQPSLTEYSAYVRAEGNHVDYGGEGYEVGVAGGGPIKVDRLGFRASAYIRNDAGYIDLVDPLNGGALKEKDVNNLETTAYQAALRAAFSDRFSGTLNWYLSRTESEHGPSVYNLPVASDSVSVRAPRFGAAPSIVSPYTISNLGFLSEPFQSLVADKNPVESELMVPSLTFVLEGDRLNFQSTTSYVKDEASSLTYDSTFANLQHGVTSAPNGSATTVGVPYTPYVTERTAFRTHSVREGWSQEFRLTARDLGPVSLVAGLYGATFELTTDAYQMGTFDTYFLPTIGLPGSAIFGPTYFADTPFGYGAVAAGQTNNVQDDELAIYGEATYEISPSWSALAGVRVSKVETSYDYIAQGQLLGGRVPTVANGGMGGGSQKDTPVTPKVQVQYKLADDRIFYALAAKAFRPGGANQTPIPRVCSGLALVGLTIEDLPRSYDPDEVWSYEVGAKLRITPTIQLNTSVFRIDWDNIQVGAGVPQCGQSPTINAGKAVSQGFDTELNAVFGPLNVNLAVGYNDAYYSETTYGIIPSTPGVTRLPAVQKGDKIPVPVWNGSVGLNYGFDINDRVSGYARGDFLYQGEYENSARPGGASAYEPDTRITDAAHQTNVRVGLRFQEYELSLFANNVFNDRPELTMAGGRTGCAVATGAACSTYTNYNPFYTASTFRPRTYGLQAIARF